MDIVVGISGWNSNRSPNHPRILAVHGGPRPCRSLDRYLPLQPARLSDDDAMDLRVARRLRRDNGARCNAPEGRSQAKTKPWAALTLFAGKLPESTGSVPDSL